MSPWRRLGYPRTLALVCAIVLGLVECFRIRARAGGADPYHADPIYPLMTMVAGFLMMLLASFRISRYPAPESDYFRLLRTTPWTPGDRLPFGPFVPIAEDLLLVGVLSSWIDIHGGSIATVKLFLFLQTNSFDDITISPLWRLLTPCILLTAFIGAWTVQAWSQSIKSATSLAQRGYCLAAALGLTIHLGQNYGLAVVFGVLLVVLLVLFPVAWWHLHSTLRMVPQSATRDDKPQKLDGKINSGATRLLAPGVTDSSVSPAQAMLVAALLFIWAGICPWKTESATDAFMIPALSITLIVVAGLARLIWVAENLASSPGLLARWATRRLFVSSYDRVFLTPLRMILTGSLLTAIAFTEIIPVRIGYPIAIVVPVVIGLLGRPTRREWRLTAAARYVRVPISPPIRPAATKVSLISK